ncbi:MAG: 2-amino-4-hydroxy-6-hydroxymethyldihydropteridine diphosphokinase [Litorimonas sp.]
MHVKQAQTINPIYIAFGANLSNPKSTFKAAIQALEENGVNLVKISGLWQSPAWPAGEGQPDYINACAQIEYVGQARQLLNVLHEVEAQLGRVRGIRNAARTLDLDLLDFRGQIIQEQSVQEQNLEGNLSNTHMIIPHPRMLTRGFVLFPLSEIAPNWQDPVLALSIEAHIAKLPLCDVAPMRWLGGL